MTGRRAKKASRLEALAVLRGERDYHLSKSVGDPGRAAAAGAIKRCIDILNGQAAPSGSSPSADPGIARRNDFIGGLLDG